MFRRNSCTYESEHLKDVPSALVFSKRMGTFSWMMATMMARIEMRVRGTPAFRREVSCSLINCLTSGKASYANKSVKGQRNTKMIIPTPPIGWFVHQVHFRVRLSGALKQTTGTHLAPLLPYQSKSLLSAHSTFQIWDSSAVLHEQYPVGTMASPRELLQLQSVSIHVGYANSFIVLTPDCVGASDRMAFCPFSNFL